jgi:hypothetical protein
MSIHQVVKQALPDYETQKNLIRSTIEQFLSIKSKNLKVISHIILKTWWLSDCKTFFQKNKK